MFSYHFSTLLLTVLFVFQKEIETLFKQFGDAATFQYFRSFRRMRVNYNSPAAAAKARIQLHQTQFLSTIINCYFAQVTKTKNRIWFLIVL